MTPDPVTLRPSDTIGQAEDIMDEQGFRQIPVVSGKIAMVMTAKPISVAPEDDLSDAVPGEFP
jgi:CBS domain-containing protein